MMKTSGVNFLLAAAVFCGSALFADSILQVYPGATLIASDFNDGDSFTVDLGGQQMHLRLYFADTPEMHISQDHDVRRLQEQAGYFGVESPAVAKSYGQQAWDFTSRVLSEPFTVYTAHAKALGGRTTQRFYGFVVTADGQDLAGLLIENGLARNFGVKRQDYNGASMREVENRMHDLESAAMLSRRGIWAHSNSDRIVKYREEQRREKEQLELLMTSATDKIYDPIDINSADQRTLEKLPGIGPVTAGRIIENRPFHAIEDMRKIRGIGEKLLDSIRPFIKIEDQQPVNG